MSKELEKLHDTIKKRDGTTAEMRDTIKNLKEIRRVYDNPNTPSSYVVVE